MKPTTYGEWKFVGTLAGEDDVWMRKGYDSRGNRATFVYARGTGKGYNWKVLDKATRKWTPVDRHLAQVLQMERDGYLECVEEHKSETGEPNDDQTKDASA